MTSIDAVTWFDLIVGFLWDGVVLDDAGPSRECWWVPVSEAVRATGTYQTVRSRCQQHIRKVWPSESSTEEILECDASVEFATHEVTYSIHRFSAVVGWVDVDPEWPLPLRRVHDSRDAARDFTWVSVGWSQFCQLLRDLINEARVK
jgi:hypothetical protein